MMGHIEHHPNDETILSYAAGSLPAAMALVVGCHLQYCSACRERVAQADAVGGSLMSQLQEKPAGVSWHTPSWSQGEEAQPSMYSKSCSGRCETNRVPFWNARVSGAPAAFAETSPLSKVRVAV